MNHLTIKFQGNEYLLIGGDMKRGGPIATREQFRAFTPSHSFLSATGDIMQRGTKIGHRDEIEVVGPAENVEYANADDVWQAVTDPKSKGY